MSLKAMFKAVHKAKNSTVTGVLETYLLSLSDTDSDRAIDVNAPSQIGSCLRSRYYARKGYQRDVNSIDPRSRRVLDNGTYFHIRTQEYLTKSGRLLLDEVPVVNDFYNIQGHTDGLLDLNLDKVISVLELKSINDNNFSKLIAPKPDHVQQGLTYVYSIETRRVDLHSMYNNMDEFLADKKARYEYYASHYQHLKDGRKHTREEKIQFQCDLHDKADTILMKCTTPITKVHFVYENKNTQEIKEFVIDSTDPNNEQKLKGVLDDCLTLNRCCDKDVTPNREGTSKSCPTCHWCAFKTECWN